MDSEEENNNFIYNNMLACAMLQIFPKKDRSHIKIWLEKLQNITGDKETLVIRDNYMWMLLLMMQDGCLFGPFNTLPPEGELPPISEVMSPQLQKEILSTRDQNFSWIDEIIKKTNTINENNVAITGIAPEIFLDQQPQPKNGVVAYFSVFSQKS